MQKPVISFEDGVALPFMKDLYPQDDGESDIDHDKMFEQMEAALPQESIKLGVLSCDLDHSPGLTWRVEDHYYVLHVRDSTYEWVLVRIFWDDDAGRYDWSQEAVSAGFKDGKAAGRSMVAALFEHCAFDLQDEDYADHRDFLKGLE